MGEGMDNSETQPPMPSLIEEFPSSQPDQVMPAYGLPSSVVMCAAATEPTMPCSSVPCASVVDAMPTEEAQAEVIEIGADTEATEVGAGTEATEVQAEAPTTKNPSACFQEDTSVVILDSAVDEEVMMYADFEVSFGTVADDHEDAWVTLPGGCTNTSTAPEVAETETSDNQEKVVSRTKWADLPDDDDGLPSGPLWPLQRSPPASPMQAPTTSPLRKVQRDPENGAPGKSYPSYPSKSRKSHQKSRLHNRTLQWKAKT